MNGNTPRSKRYDTLMSTKANGGGGGGAVRQLTKATQNQVLIAKYMLSLWGIIWVGYSHFLVQRTVNPAQSTGIDLFDAGVPNEVVNGPVAAGTNMTAKAAVPMIIRKPGHPVEEGYDIFKREKYRYKEENIPVFYNLYIKDQQDYQRVKKIVDEQFNKLLPVHKPIYVNNIGVPLDFNEEGIIRKGPLNTTDNPVEVLGVYESASEFVTLRNMWEYCQNPDNDFQKVAYLHSKGSSVNTADNGKLRRFLTAGLLSKECASMGVSCNMCSARFSPVPHPHAPGNFFMARCSYVRQLRDPLTFESAMEDMGYEGGDRFDRCDGRGRYAAEHWALSHPSAKPCDIFQSNLYTWNDWIPTVKLLRRNIELANFPRFKLDTYLKSRDVMCPFRGASMSFRINEYKKLYDTDPPKDWWGYGFFKNEAELGPLKDEKWVTLPDSARLEIVKMGYNHYLWDLKERPYVLWGKQWRDLDGNHRKTLETVFGYDEIAWNEESRKEIRDAKRIRDSVDVFEPNMSFDRCSAKPRSEIYSWYTRNQGGGSGSGGRSKDSPSARSLREYVYENYPKKPPNTRRLLIVASVPRDETHLLSLWSQLECFTKPVNHVLVAAPNWARPFVERVLQLARRRIPHFARGKVTVEAKYFLNNRHDVGLWCDAYESLTAVEKDGSDGYDEYGLVNDSIFALRPFSAIFDNLQHQNIEVSSLSYSFTEKHETGTDVASYWVDSVFRAFDRSGIDTFREFSCVLEDDEKFCVDTPEDREKCIFTNLVHDLAKEYRCEKVQGLYPTEPTELLKTSQIWKLSWAKDTRYWRMLVDHAGFPIANVNEPGQTGGWYHLDEAKSGWSHDPLLKNCTKHIMPKIDVLFDGLNFDALAKPFHRRLWRDIPGDLRVVAKIKLGYTDPEGWDRGLYPPALKGKYRWYDLSKGEQDVLARFECSMVPYDAGECFRR